MNTYRIVRNKYKYYRNPLPGQFGKSIYYSGRVPVSSWQDFILALRKLATFYLMERIQNLAQWLASPLCIFQHIGVYFYQITGS